MEVDIISAETIEYVVAEISEEIDVGSVVLCGSLGRWKCAMHRTGGKCLCNDACRQKEDYYEGCKGSERAYFPNHDRTLHHFNNCKKS